MESIRLGEALQAQANEVAALLARTPEEVVAHALSMGLALAEIYARVTQAHGEVSLSVLTPTGNNTKVRSTIEVVQFMAKGSGRRTEAGFEACHRWNAPADLFDAPKPEPATAKAPPETIPYRKRSWLDRLLAG